MAGSSTASSTAEHGLEFKEKDTTNEPPLGVMSPIDVEVYPTGLKLGMIIVALMLSMFLVRHHFFTSLNLP